MDIMRIAFVLTMFSTTESTLWRWRHDPAIGFPQGFRLGRRSIGWRYKDLLDFQRTLRMPIEQPMLEAQRKAFGKDGGASGQSEERTA